MKRLGVCAALVAAALTGSSAWGVVPLKEDLSTCKLTHGEVLIPAADNGAAGTFVRFSDASTASLPLSDSGKPLSAAVSAERLRNSGKADVGYVSDDGGTLWVLSGRAMDLGTSYLHDAAGMKLSEPMEMKAFGGKPAGMYSGVEEGRTFLLKTSDGHYALMRVLNKTASGLRVQYVYQSSGGLSFNVPESSFVSNTDALAPAANADAATEPAVAAVTPAAASVVQDKIAVAEPVHTIATPEPTQKSKPTVLEPYMYTFIEQRKLLVQRRLDTLSKDATTSAQMDDKVQAIEDLVNLHADEAAAILVQQVSFVDTRRSNHEFNPDVLHPCFAGLKKMGRPAVESSLKELATMTVVSDQQQADTDSPLYRAKLLGQVVRAIEGNDVAEFIFKREKDATTDTNRKAMYDVLISARN